MTRLNPILLCLTFVIAVAALVLALWPVVADTPWEDGVAEAELSQILQAAQEASSKASKEEKEAERLKTCASLQRMDAKMLPPQYPGMLESVRVEAFKIAIENHCEY